MQSDDEIRDFILKLTGTVQSNGQPYRIVFEESSDAQFAEVVFAMLHDDDPEVVNAALVAMLQFRMLHHSECREKALSLLDIPSHTEHVLIMLQRLGDDTYLPRVMKFLSYPIPAVRIEAIDTLSRFHYPDLYETALHMVDDPDEDVRIHLICLLRRWKDPRVTTKFINIMYFDVSFSVQKTAAYQLLYMTNPEGRKTAQAWIDTNVPK